VPEEPDVSSPGLRLHDSLTRETAPLRPVVPGRVGIYVCGATPQSSPHIGHVRAQVVYDVLRRWLEHSGLHVTLVRNVTDIDDKILAKAAEQGRPWWAHAYRYEREFTAAYDALRILPPTYEPRATGHVTEMVELMQRLLDAGHAYHVEGTADLYFDVRSFPAYGRLTRQGLGDLAPADDTDPSSPGASATPATSRCGSPPRTPSPRPRRGPPRGGAAAPGGTWSAPRWPGGTWVRSSTCTAAGSTSASRTTRTSSPSPAPPATASPASGCTPRWSRRRGRR
jgi:cysteinyl-tRNA synthetase